MSARSYRFGGFRLDLATRSLWCDGVEIALPPKAFDCLGHLVENADRAVGRDELIAAVWGRVDISDNALGQAILQARRALRSVSGSAIDAIRTVPRFGYHWQLPVTLEQASAQPDGPVTAPSPETTLVPRAVPVEPPATARTTPTATASVIHALRPRGRHPNRVGGWVGALLIVVLAAGIPSATGIVSKASTVPSTVGTRPAGVIDRGALVDHEARAAWTDSSVQPEPASETASEGWLARLASIEAALVSGRVDDARAELGRMDARDHERPDVRYQVARVDFMQGRLDAAHAALLGLLDDLPSERQPVLRARILNTLGNLAYLRDDDRQVLAYSDAAIAALTGIDAPAESGRAWVGRASAHTSLKQYDQALADYARARVAFSDAGDGLALARVDAYQGLLEFSRGRPADALILLPGAANRLQGFEAVIEELHARVGLVYVHLALSRPADAYAQNARLIELGERVGDVRRRHYADFARVRSLTATGRLDAAEALLATLRTTTASGPGVLLDNNRIDLPMLAARLAFARDDVAAALPDARAAIALAGENASERAMAYLINWQMLVRLGQLDQAQQLAVTADRVKPDMDAVTRIHLALLEAGQAEVEGDMQDARAAFDRALALADDHRVPAELVQVAQPFVRYLLGQGDLTYASVVAGRVAGWATADYNAALVQVELYSALERSKAWSAALQQARALAGERRIPPALAMETGAITAAGPVR